MSTRAILALAALWVLSLVAVVTIVNAQVYRMNPLAEPRILSGPDFGIRIEAEQNGKPVGRLVVRIDGEWVEAQLGSAMGLQPLR
jgi:hypothetical protein